MADITTAKRLMAAVSAEAAGILGAGISRPCFIGRYNRAAQVVLADGRLQGVLTAEDRRLIAGFIESEGDDEDRGATLHVRLTESERVRLAQLAEGAGLNVSEYVRGKVFEG